MGITKSSHLAGIAVIGILILAGCSHHFETGFHDWSKVQVQFYAPEGAQVTLGQINWGAITPDRTHQISSYGDGKTRLERTPEQTATFNLAPGSYEFKYNAAEGWPNISIYGELNVYSLSGKASVGAKKMLKRCFIPIALPSPGTVASATPKDDIFPYQSSANRLKISQAELERLAMGDMVTKVVFIANLKKAKEEIKQIEIELTKLKGEKQRLQGMLSEAQLDWLENPSSKKFIKLQVQLKKLEQAISDKEDRMARLQRLLKADNVIIRQEMLVLATDEILPAHEDPVEAAKQLGEVVLVLRLGGRHQQWGKPAAELASYNK